MNTAKSVSEDLANREPVWLALSDMFLDTDTSLSRPWRVEQLSKSPYSLDQIESILVEEVFPVCKYNLISVAGEWAGFDPLWLREQILRRLGSPIRHLHILSPARFVISRSNEWRATKEAIALTRQSKENNAA